MTHRYRITGMTCESCSAKVQALLASVVGIVAAKVDLEHQQAEISMQRHVPLNVLNEALAGTRYSIEELMPAGTSRSDPEEKSKLRTYLPIFLIFGYIIAVTVLIELQQPAFRWEEWMRFFMAAFFLTFSFFKLLDVPAFAASYSSYDIVAKHWFRYGYVYPFLELGLGILFLFPEKAPMANILTLLVMGVSIIGVIQSVLSKRKIQCACLGAVFQLPMSTVTIIEDALMIGMAGIGLFL